MNRTLLDAAIQAALAVRENAYAPYSEFKVGAVLVSSDGGMFVGCNVENASFGLTQCAERSAVTSATAEGRRDIEVCVIVTDTDEPKMPCGACRQVLAEYGTDILIVGRTVTGLESQRKLSELLPESFTAASLGKRI